MDPALFYPEQGDTADEPKRVCRDCPVQIDCLEHALRYNEKIGVWGGCSERDRRKIIKSRAAAARRERERSNLSA
jgi:WhiB family redox-sensing transcriptional regulator